MAASSHGSRILRNIAVPMRDGVTLATSVHLPEGDGPFPAVLVRTAYNRVPMQGVEFVQRGMAFIAQDCRGRYASGGEWYPFIHEQEDGEDTLNWIASQPWCDGRIGMFGDSYLAATQFYAALSGSEHLCALNPRFMAGDCWKRAYYCDGAFSLGLTWSWLCFECSAATSEAAMMPLFDVPSILGSLPIIAQDEASGGAPNGPYRDYVSHCQYDELWEPLNIRAQLGCVRAPMLLIGGWYDYYAGETFANYLALREHAPNQALRDSHRVLVGPWTHGISGESALGELDFGPEATSENDVTMRWLDCLLHGGDATDFQQAPVRVFVMGANEWRDEDAWPPTGTRYVKYYLRSGDTLAAEGPGDEAPDEYEYDPGSPAPTLGGNHSIGPYNPGLYEHARPGPFDQQPVEARSDVLTFTSDVLEADLEVTGPVTMTLWASSSAPDTDFVARLCDVYPDGRSMNITKGVIRARFRESVWGSPKLLDPDQVYEFTIDLQATSNLFRKGHRLRVDITSSCFPLWDRNLNTGGDPATDTQWRVAHQRIYHDAGHASHITLPMLDS